MRFNSVPGDDQKGRLEISATGSWVETILWEVPLMACLSEIYFRTADRDWNYEGQEGEYIHILSRMIFSNFTRNNIRVCIRESENHAFTWDRFQRVWDSETAILPYTGSCCQNAHSRKQGLLRQGRETCWDEQRMFIFPSYRTVGVP